ncbi:sodium-independent sulfate anion transporter-like [Oratosquilla oratoria]|uniref:sodium-independent sulfate anion transporter-like n=1 Tax=Oratosquilla oratoria TaxID=337810 RepID=UPI003F76FD29
MGKADYTKKMENLLTDTSTYTPQSEQQAKEESRRFNTDVRKILKRTNKGKHLLHLLKEDPKTPTIRGISKTHKAGIPMRPITNGIDRPIVLGPSSLTCQSVSRALTGRTEIPPDPSTSSPSVPPSGQTTRRYTCLVPEHRQQETVAPHLPPVTMVYYHEETTPGGSPPSRPPQSATLQFGEEGRGGLGLPSCLQMPDPKKGGQCERRLGSRSARPYSSALGAGHRSLSHGEELPRDRGMGQYPPSFGGRWSSLKSVLGRPRCPSGWGVGDEKDSLWFIAVPQDDGKYPDGDNCCGSGRRKDVDVEGKGNDGGGVGGSPLRRRSIVEAFKNVTKKKAQKVCTRKTLNKRLPILDWLPKYSAAHLLGDLVAGFTMGLMIVPQGLAHSLVAGLPPTYGLYSSFVGCFVYTLLGKTPELTLGPTAILAIMTQQYAAHGGTDYAVLLCFVSGIVELMAGFANFGFLITFISKPVLSGFTSAAALTIGSAQLKGLLGLKLQTGGVLDTWVQVGRNVALTRWQDLILGIACIIFIMALKEIRTLKWSCLGAGEGPKTPWQRAVAKVVFFLSLSRNAIVVLLCAGLAYALRGDGQPFTLTGYVIPGVPPAQVPPLSTTVGNRTLSFGEILSDVGIGVVMIPFIAILYNIAIVTAFAKGNTVDATQEIVALGLANIIGAFFRSMPTAGAMGRAAVNSSSGIRTPAAGIVTGTIVLLALAFLTPAFSFIPKTTLAAVLVCAVSSMVDYEILKPLWRTRKSDLVPLVTTFVTCLLWGLEWGILLGVGVNLAMVLFSSAKPEVQVSQVPAEIGHDSASAHVLVRPSSGAFFPSCPYLQKEIRNAGVRQGGGVLPVVVDFARISAADYTTAKTMKGLAEEFKKRGQPLVLMGLQSQVKEVLLSLCPDLRVYASVNELRQFLTVFFSFSCVPPTTKANSQAFGRQNIGDKKDKTFGGMEGVPLADPIEILKEEESTLPSSTSLEKGASGPAVA